MKLVQSVLPDASHFVVGVLHSAGAVFQIISILPLKEYYSLLVGLFRNIFSLPTAHVVNKLPFVPVSVGEYKDAKAAHQIGLKLACVFLGIGEGVNSLSVFVTVYKAALVVISIGVEFLSFSVWEAVFGLSDVPTAIKHKLFNHDFFLICGSCI
jgi:hypothetical protein